MPSDITISVVMLIKNTKQTFKSKYPLQIEGDKLFFVSLPFSEQKTMFVFIFK